MEQIYDFWEDYLRSAIDIFEAIGRSIPPFDHFYFPSEPPHDDSQSQPNRQPGGIANKPNNYNNWNVGLLSCVQ